MRRLWLIVAAALVSISVYAAATISGSASISGAASLGPTPTPVNLLIHCQSGTDGEVITPALAASASVQNLSAVWAVFPDPLTAFTVEDSYAMPALLRPVSIGGTTYTGAGGTRCWKVDHSGTNQAITLEKVAAVGSLSFGGWIKSTLPGVTAGGQYDLLAVTGLRSAGGVISCVFQLVDNTGGNFGLRAHASSPGAGSTFGATYASTTDTLYWVTGKFDSVLGKCSVWIYSAAGAKLAESECDVDAGSLTNASLQINPTEHGLNPSAYTLFGNVIWDHTNAVFPLGVP